MMSNETAFFPVSSQVLDVVIHAGATIRNPDVQPPVVRSDKTGRYIEMLISPDSEELTEQVACIRRISLDDLSVEEWKRLNEQCASLQLRACIDNGLSKELEKIGDERVRRIIYTLLTFLNPRQVALMLYLYREAYRQKSGPRVYIKVNEMLGVLGYTKAGDGGYPAKYRSQLHRDLVALHRTEILIARRQVSRRTSRTKLVFKSILRIKDVDLDNLPRDFDIVRAAEDGYGSADAYTVDLEFFDTDPGGTVLFATDLDFNQRRFARTGDDYETRLMVYLASCLKEDTQVVVASKRALYKKLDLLGSNGGRNTRLLWRTIELLQTQGYILKATELPGKRYSTKIEFTVNPEKIRLN